MGFELPEKLKKFGVHVATEEEIAEMSKIDQNFCMDEDEENTPTNTCKK